MNKIKVLGVIIFVIILFFVLKKPIRKAFYNSMYKKGASNTIEWRAEYNLKWNDFNYEEANDGTEYFFARIGIGNRYEFTSELNIEYESKTLFYPLDSYISDTTDMSNLEILQARFDLCELYRLKLENKIKNLNFNEFPDSRKDSVDLNTEKYYTLFENEWNEIIELPRNEIYKKIKLISKRLNEEK